jgi:hypothetical protein
MEVLPPGTPRSVETHHFSITTNYRYATGERAYRVSLASDDENDDATPTEDVEDVDNDVAVSRLRVR